MYVLTAPERWNGQPLKRRHVSKSQVSARRLVDALNLKTSDGHYLDCACLAAGDCTAELMAIDTC